MRMHLTAHVWIDWSTHSAIYRANTFYLDYSILWPFIWLPILAASLSLPPCQRILWMYFIIIFPTGSAAFCSNCRAIPMHVPCAHWYLFYCTRFTGNHCYYYFDSITNEEKKRDGDGETESKMKQKRAFVRIVGMSIDRIVYFNTQYRMCRDATTRASYPFLFFLFFFIFQHINGFRIFNFASLFSICVWSIKILGIVCDCAWLIILSKLPCPLVVAKTLYLTEPSSISAVISMRSSLLHSTSPSLLGKSDRITRNFIFKSYRFRLCRRRSLTCQLARGNVLLI